MNRITQKAERGHDLFELYEKIDTSIQSIMLTASQDLDQDIDLVKLIKHCKDYFFHARYSYERESLQCLNSDVFVLARHMKKLVRKVGETTHPKVVNP